MRIYLLGYLLVVLYCPSHAAGSKVIDPNSDSSIRQLFSEYQNALVSRDSSFPFKGFISDDEYRKVLDFVKEKQPNCVGDSELAFTSTSNLRTYRDIISSKLVINSLTVDKIEYNYSCGDLLIIPRVICTVRYSDTRVLQVPFLLVKTANEEYKILKNFLNYNIFK